MALYIRERMGSLMDMTKDVSEMDPYQNISMFPEHIESALDTRIDNIPNVTKVCICGVGTYSVAGEIMADHADGFSDTPIPVVRGLCLPRWVDKDTLVIIMSGTGNNPEILQVYDQAAGRGCSILCITSGGELKAKCTSNGNLLVEVPHGTDSEGSIGYVFGFLAVIFEQLGICNSRSELKDLMPSLKTFRDELKRNDSCILSSIAYAVNDRIPAIYGSMDMRSAALRWKSQMNTNSKVISFYGTLPEFNHNEIIGWTEDPCAKDFVPVVLYDESASDVMKVLVDSTIDVLTDRGLNVISVPIKGSNNMERNLKCIMLGDFVSMFLSCIKT